jgi:DNA end-binding protein Ku
VDSCVAPYPFGESEIDMAEPTWNGFLRLSLVSCRVFLSPATSDRKWVRMEPLSAATGNPVIPGYVDARTGAAVTTESTVQAHQYENGRYVQVSESELRTLAGPPSQVIDIDSFIPQGSIDRLFFESFHYVYPDEPLANDTLFTLRTAMLRKGQMGLGHMFAGGRQRHILVEPRGNGLMLTILRSADQLEDVEFEVRAETNVPVELIEVAESLIARRATSVDPSAFDDPYHRGLHALVGEKVRSATGAPSGMRAAAPAPAPSPAPSAYGSGAAASASLRALEREPEPPPPPPPPPVPEPAAVSEPEPEPEPEPAIVEPPIYAREPEPMPPSAPVVTEPEPEPEPEREPELARYAPETSPSAGESYEPVVGPAADAAVAEAPLPAAAAAESAVAAMAEEPGSDQEVGSEIFLHIIGLGERRYVGSGWAGTPGSRQPIEALSIRPAEDLPRSAIEFRVFARDGRATSWVTDGNYAGSWGRRLPLTGFAVRPTEGHGGDVEIVYEGYFSEGGVIGPKRDGEVCTSTIPDDPLEAVLVRILGHAA